MPEIQTPSGSDAVRIGVYVCHCGTNIAGTVDVRALTEYAAGLRNVIVAREYKYMCSDPGQALVEKDIAEHQLNRVVVASCSPLLHEPTFRRAITRAGINAFFLQMVNIREHVSWVHLDKQKATEKAKDLVRAAVRRVALHKPLQKRKVPINPERSGRGWRNCRNPCGFDACRSRQAGLPDRTRADDRRPHGDVRQDVPHTGLCRLHSYTEDDDGGIASQYQAVDLFGSRSG